jgi:hypothetical protein
VDGAGSKASFNLVARAEGSGIADGVTVFQGDAVTATKQQGRVKALGFLLNELQAV